MQARTRLALTSNASCEMLGQCDRLMLVSVCRQPSVMTATVRSTTCGREWRQTSQSHSQLAPAWCRRARTYRRAVRQVE